MNSEVGRRSRILFHPEDPYEENKLGWSDETSIILPHNAAEAIKTDTVSIRHSIQPEPMDDEIPDHVEIVRDVID